MKRTLIPLLLICGALTTFTAETEEGFQPIFNGKDLAGWDGNPALWSVKEGAIVGRTTVENPIKANTFLIWTNGTPQDFELRAQFKITANNDKGFANSGIQYRSKVVDAAGWVVGGYQADMEAGVNYTGILYDERGVAGGRGIMAARGEKVLWGSDGKKQVTGSLGKSEDIQAAIRKTDWNDYVIIAQGNRLQHFINGKPTVDVTDDCESKALKSGVLALQVHVGGPMTVEFKNLRLKTLPAAKSAGSDAERLNGVWNIASSEANGAPLPPEGANGLALTITDGKYVLAKDTEIDRGTFSVDTSKTPKRMDIRPDAGPGSGRLIPAICEFDGETLRVCYATAEGAARPTAFKTAPDSGDVLITYRRKSVK